MVISSGLPLAGLPKGLHQPKDGHDSFTIMHRPGLSLAGSASRRRGRRARGLSGRLSQQALEGQALREPQTEAPVLKT